MSDPIYVIQLGSGLYLDSDGAIHQGAVPPVPSYSAPGGPLVLDLANKLGKTFKDIGDALPNKSDGKKFDDFRKKLTGLGAPDELIDLLGKVGEIASAVGTVFIVLGVAMAAAKLLGLFGDGPSPLEKLIEARFKSLETQITSLQVFIKEKDLRNLKNHLISAVATVKNFVAQRDSGTLTDTQIESDFQLLSANLASNSMPDIFNLLDRATYEMFFVPDEYDKV
jgi:hypothetical protein